MLTFLLVTLLILSIGFNVAAFILIRNFLSKINTYEKWILEFKQSVVDTLAVMRELDTKGTFATSLNDKGTFEADDQVGHIFKDLLELIEILNDRTK